MITFTVQGTSVPWQRVGRSRFGAYVPKETRAWKTQIAWESKLHRPDKPFEGPLFMMLIFSFKKPKSHKNDLYCIGRSDIDNYCKSVMDALHDQFYKNDNQIVSLSAVKVYGPPGVQISVGKADEYKQKSDSITMNRFIA